MKGNSCSGVAATEPENAMVPIASAPRAAAARRKFSLNGSRLNTVGALFERSGASFGASLWAALPGDGFRMLSSEAQNGFVWYMNSFVAMSWRTDTFNKLRARIALALGGWGMR